MLDAQDKIVSIESFRAARATGGASTRPLSPGIIRRTSPGNVEHRERMLRFLRAEAQAQKEEVQGRLLL